MIIYWGKFSQHAKARRLKREVLLEYNFFPFHKESRDTDSFMKIDRLGNVSLIYYLKEKS